jgi:acetylornithine deacetylase/succinyl-diaminopimelate desuccinylase-like protein
MTEKYLDELRATATYDLTYQALYLLGSLIKISSLSGGENQTIDFLEKFLEEQYTITTTRKDNNIWCCNKHFHPEKPTLLLTCNANTANPNGKWSIDPFSPAIADGKLFGLGSNGAGASLVSLLSAFLYYYTWKAMPINICLAITSQEHKAERALMLNELMPISFAIAGAPTEMEMGIGKLSSIVLDESQNGLSTLVKAGSNIGRKIFVLPSKPDRSPVDLYTLMMGPGSPGGSGASDEYVYLSQIKDGIEIFIEMIKSLIMITNHYSPGMQSK